MIKIFKQLIWAAFFTIAATAVNAQAQAWPKLDKSPLDVVYFSAT